MKAIDCSWHCSLNWQFGYSVVTWHWLLPCMPYSFICDHFPSLYNITITEDYRIPQATVMDYNTSQPLKSKALQTVDVQDHGSQH
ncbi:hypothetical protein chiPu_0018066 [Chiloscyllium punctatum]|uniref:Uncharacterized protein n=1 Tax=Chiloscyllium punctatum TaxID=137246 RepID=A0A401RKY9_CHIPU|nr:hypothetical protein [Chiloscyllium punctatum]